MKQHSSRERMLAAVNCQSTDYVPCEFMIFTGLRARCADSFELVERELEMGLDARVNISDLAIGFDPEVSTKQWKENVPGERWPLLHKEYRTPAGKLQMVVRQTEDWPYGDSVPLFEDYLAARSKKYLVSSPADLPALRYLFVEPSGEVIEEFRVRSSRAKAFAQERDLLLCGGWFGFDKPDINEIGHDGMCMGIDALMWLCGPQAPLLWAYDDPGFLEELISIIALWNRRRLEITLDAEVDMVIERAWYEGTDFWSPALYSHFIAPVLQADVNLAHQAGTKFGYIITSGMMGIMDDLLEIHPDAIVGVDPVQGKGTTLESAQQKVNGRLCLWGGVNSFLTLERGSTQEVRIAVEEAIAILGKSGGFVLSPVDNVRELTPAIEDNLKTFIDTWKANRYL